MGGTNPIIFPGLGFAQPTISISDRELFNDWNTLDNWQGIGSFANLVLDNNHVEGTKSIKFDKISGADTFAGIESKTALNIDAARFIPGNNVFALHSITSVTDINHLFLRVGTDASNYNEWRYADTALNAGAFWDFQTLLIAQTQFAVTGVGWDLIQIDYIAIGFEFDLITDVLTNMRVDTAGII